MDIKQLDQEIDDVADDPVDRLLKEKKPASSGKPIAILALLVAMASVIATGWHWWQAHQGDPNQATQTEALAHLQESQQQLANSVASFEQQLGAAESPIDAAEFSRQGQRLRTVESQLAGMQGQSGEDQASISAMQGNVRSLEQRLSATESGLVSVAASSQNSSVELNIAEIDFLLRTASQRLSLFSDPAAADLALLAADIQLEALNDPMFLSVRQRIATARQTLAALPVIDHVQITAQITDLQLKIPGLPFRGEVEPQAQAQAELPDDAGWWASFKQTMSSLVTVRRRVPEDQSLLSLEDKDYLRQGLWLQLESARFSLMRNDAGGWNGSLDRLSDTVEQFFQNDSSGVQALLLEITALKQVNVAPQMPDISVPWAKLRQLRDSRRLLQSPTPVEDTGTEDAQTGGASATSGPAEGRSDEDEGSGT
jgi:uroporphyrin-3 C-methyltransferase